MNWLAHLFLSEQNVDFQMGNILADPLKGKLWSDASIDLSKGMSCLLSTSDAADERSSVYIGCSLLIKKKKTRIQHTERG